MFRPSERLSNTGRADSRRYLKRAGLFAGGLVLLWIALQLFPTPSPEPPVYSDDAGSVAASDTIRTNHGPRLFTLGNLAAFIILVGGGGVAYHLHKRNVQSSGGSSPIESIGELAIGQGQALRLVRCGGAVLLIGATAHEITLLRDFDPALFEVEEEEEEEEYVSTSQRQHVRTSTRPQLSPAFADVLRQYAGRYVNMQSNA